MTLPYLKTVTFCLLLLMFLILVLFLGSTKQWNNVKHSWIQGQVNETSRQVAVQNAEMRDFSISQDLSNDTKDQFTVVIMTYKREEQIIKSLRHLNGLSSLNKTIIVWNDQEQPPPDFTYLNLTYEVQVLKQKQNSINNRFFIYEEIETDAVFCLDDDILMNHSVIDSCFRVWKSDKYALVGVFPRSHQWVKTTRTWRYSFNVCPTSMVLLGGTFYNKIYNYMYRTWMPKDVIRLVDEKFNCEDIAMNFLVSKLTRRPPIRVDFEVSSFCPSCSSNLAMRKTHYKDRHECLNRLSTIYGQMPLLYTYSSVDSGKKRTKCVP